MNCEDNPSLIHKGNNIPKIQNPVNSNNSDNQVNKTHLSVILDESLFYPIQKQNMTSSLNQSGNLTNKIPKKSKFNFISQLKSNFIDEKDDNKKLNKNLLGKRKNMSNIDKKKSVKIERMNSLGCFQDSWNLEKNDVSLSINNKPLRCSNVYNLSNISIPSNLNNPNVIFNNNVYINKCPGSPKNKKFGNFSSQSEKNSFMKLKEADSTRDSLGGKIDLITYLAVPNKEQPSENNDDLDVSKKFNSFGEIENDES